MTAPTLLLSDLHLPTTPSPLRDAFLRFVDGPARSAAHVYILGDLFDAWIGDDIGLEDYAAECAALSRLTCAGVPVSFQRGNRDFLVGRHFAEVTGVTLLPEAARRELGGDLWLLMHGDTLCTDDVAYQRYRRVTARPWAQHAFLALPIGCRRRIARGLQRASHDAKSEKADAIMDVNDDAVRAALQHAGIPRLVHGHTHRPGHYTLAGNHPPLTRVVLPDWRPGVQAYLAVDDDGWHRHTL